MVDLRDRIRPDWPTVLEQVLARARELGGKGVVAFDLDSTLFDNRPRQARIVREFGEAKGIAELLRCAPGDIDSGWDLTAALERLGLPAAQAKGLYPELKKFWGERFFTSDYCADDVEVRGASQFVQALVATQVQVAYVTGRHEGMRAGTEEAMRREGFPLGLPNTLFMMKPQKSQDDDVFKRAAHARLLELGTLIAAFDNEPIHANDYRIRFPEAVVVHLATDHSGRQTQLADGVRSIPHFQRP